MLSPKETFFEEIKAGFFGDFLVSKGHITPEQLREALALQETRKHRLRIGELLCELGYLAPWDLIESLQEYKLQLRIGELLVSNGDLRFLQLLEAIDEQRISGGHLGEVLVRLEFCTEEQVAEALELQRALHQDDFQP